jgi:hypothetical protein
MTRNPLSCRIFISWGYDMSKETPKTDPRERTDWGTSKQTDKPWKGNPNPIFPAHAVARA